MVFGSYYLCRTFNLPFDCLHRSAYSSFQLVVDNLFLFLNPFDSVSLRQSGFIVFGDVVFFGFH